VLTIREAAAGDIPVLLRMLHESSEDQGFPGEVVVTEEDLLHDGFGAVPRFYALIAAWNDSPAGMALYFFNYSTWVSRYGLYLEDLYVDRDHRHKGVAKALMAHVARIAIAHGCGRLQWMVHCRNERAIRVYEAVGAQSIEEWTMMLISGDGIRSLADSP
jgi:GNAT superfamily N-acetyltransferase